jgi:glucose/arabinose dehydrogenase
MEQPVYYWDPIIAPSGMVFYTGDAFPGWKGSVLIGGLASESLVRLTFDGDRVASEERFAIDERVRDVQQGADGLIYLITDSGSGRILRVRPKSGP